MAQLGFTFYPKDWWTSDSFYAMNPFERYIYLELLFMMYDNEGSIKNNKVMVERRLMTTIKDDVWLKISDLMVEDGDQLTHRSVNKRLAKTLANRENGIKGGRPKKEENSEFQKPKKPKSETQEKTQNNPPYKREIESKREIEREYLGAPGNSENDNCEQSEKYPYSPSVPLPNRQPDIPTLEQVQMYFRGAGGSIDEGSRFFNHYSAVGWMKGLSPIINWRPIANTWISTGPLNQSQTSTQQTDKSDEQQKSEWQRKLEANEAKYGG